VLPAAVGAVTAIAKSEAVSRIGEGLQGLIGDTPTDKARKRNAQALLDRALSGDRSALETLTQQAFERRVSDGLYSPEAVRKLAKGALQQYYKATGETPPEKYAAQLNLPVTPKKPGVIEQVFAPVLKTVGDTAADAAEERVRAQATAAVPYVIGGIVVVALLVLAFRKSS
jgi:hypothetical protein